jgi:hypothetical protein
MIKPIECFSDKMLFRAKKYPVQEFDKIVAGNSVIAKKTLETVEFEDGSYAVISSRYEGINIKDRIIHLYDDANNCLKAVIQTWFGSKDGKPNTLVINKKTLDKIG